MHAVRLFLDRQADLSAAPPGSVDSAAACRVAPGGGEVLGALAVTVHAEVPITRLREMIFAYPTFHRAIETALADLDV